MFLKDAAGQLAVLRSTTGVMDQTGLGGVRPCLDHGIERFSCTHVAHMMVRREAISANNRILLTAQLTVKHEDLRRHRDSLSMYTPQWTI